MDRSTPQKTAEQFFRSQLVDRDLLGALECLTEDVEWIGTGALERVRGRAEAEHSIADEIAQLPDGYDIEFSDVRESMAGPDFGVVIGGVALTEKHMGSRMDCRFTASCVRAEGGFKILTLHMSVAAAVQQSGEYYPITFVKEKTLGFLTDFIREALPGGLICSTFCDDPKMLSMNNNFAYMLGYSSPEEVLHSTGGYSSALLAKQSRFFADRSTKDELLKGKIIEDTLLLKKKDGSEMWVREHYHLYNAEDGTKYIYTYLIDISDIMAAEEKLRISDEEYRLALVHSGRMVYRFTPANRTCYMPQELADLFGVRSVAEDVPESLIREGVIAPESSEEYRKFYESIIRGEKHGEAVARRRLRDGTLRWFRAEFTNIFDSAGKPASAVISVKDITRERDARITNELDKEQLSTAIRRVYPLVISANLSRNTYCVVSGEDKLDRRPPSDGNLDEFIMDNRCLGIFADDIAGFRREFSRAALMEAFGKRGESFRRMELRKEFPDGVLHWMEFLALSVRNPYNEDIIAISMGRCIDEQKAAEAKLREALEITNGELAHERYYQRVLDDSMPIGSLIVRADKSSFSHVGGQLMKELGYTRGDIDRFRTERLKGLIHPDDLESFNRVTNEARRTLAPSYEQEFRFIRKDGSVVWVLECATLVTDIDGAPAYLCLFVNVTKQKELEEELRLTQEETRIAMASMGKMICLYDIRSRVLSMPHEYALKHGLTDDMCKIAFEKANLMNLDPLSRPTYLDFYDAIHRGERHASAAVKMLCRDGKWHWERGESITLYDGEGKPAKAIIAVEDITDRYEKDIAFERIANRINALDERGTLYYETDMTAGTAQLIKGKLLKDIPDIRDLALLNKICLKKYVAPEDLEMLTKFCTPARMMKNFSQGRTYDTADFLRLDGGKKLWTRVEAEVLEDPYTANLRAYVLFSDIDEEKRSLLSVTKRAETDGLTGLYNRTAFQEIMEKSIAPAEGVPCEPCALMICDIDELKRINDMYGHDAGDSAITATAEALSSVIPKDGAAGRVGGDEFMAFIPNIESRARLEDMLVRFIKNVNNNPFGDDKKRRLGCSAGALIFRPGTKDFAQLYKETDNALYEAKDSGKNQYVIV